MLKNLKSDYKTSIQIYENRIGKISADEKTGENFLKKKKKSSNQGRENLLV